MRIYPKETFSVKSRLSISEIIESLENLTDTRSGFSLKQLPNKVFKGEINVNSFKIHRKISYRNSFLPICIGKVSKSSQGSKIDIIMRLHRAVAYFMLFWLIGVSFGLFFLSITVLSKESEMFTLLIPICMLLFGVIMTSSGFWYEANKTKQELIKTLTKQSDRPES